MYYYDSTIGQTVFQGPDRNANTLQNASLETSLVIVNGVVLDNDQYTLTEVTLTLNDGCLTSDDIVSVIVFREPAEAEDSVGQGQITTVDVLTIPPGSDSTRPINLPDNLELVTTQFDANWFLNDRIDELDLKVDGINVSVDLSDYSTTIEMVAADDTTLADAKAYTDNEIAAIPPAGNVDLSSYALTTYVDDQDSKLQIQIDSLSASGGYNDAWIQIAIDAGDASTLVDAKAYTDSEIAAIPPTDLSAHATKKEVTDGDAKALVDSKAYTDNEIAAIPPTDLSSHATKKEVTDGDAKALTDSKKYTDDKIDAIVFPPGTIVRDTEPPNAPNGTNWFDTVRLELFVRASQTWVASSPLGARVTQGELLQSELLDRVTTIEEIQSQPAGDVDKEYVDAQDATKIGNAGEQILPTPTWKLRARKVDDSGNYSYLAIQDDSLKLYHVADPTADAHGMSRGYADGRYQFIQKPIGFKVDQSGTCTLNTIPNSGEFCGLNNSSPGSSTAANNYFGNWNAGIRVHIDKLLNPQGSQFEVTERYSIAGTVSIFGKDTGKLFFKHGITAVVRDSSHPYVELIFATRVPTFGTGSINDESKYVVIVDGLTSTATNTTLVPEGAGEE
jgi:hypothetical protein